MKDRCGLAFSLLRGRAESDLFAAGRSWRHEFSNRVKYDFELTIVLAFELVQSARQFGIPREHLSKSYESA